MLQTFIKLKNQAATVSDYQGTATRKSYAPGVAFPLTEKAIEALSELKKTEERSFNFVSLVKYMFKCFKYMARFFFFFFN